MLYCIILKILYITSYYTTLRYITLLYRELAEAPPESIAFTQEFGPCPAWFPHMLPDIVLAADMLP